MRLETGYLSSRQVIERPNGCQASGIVTGEAARQISKIGVHREGHTGMGSKILSEHAARVGWNIGLTNTGAGNPIATGAHRPLQDGR